MMKRAVVAAIAVLVANSISQAATVSLVTPQDVPAGSPTLTFDGLNNSAFGGPTTANYSEQGVNIAGPIFAYPRPNGLPSDLWMASYNRTLVFPQPVTFVAWEEYYSTTPSVVLFADAQGNQPLGTFDINIAWQPSSSRFHGFTSDTPFKRMSFGLALQTHWVNNLRFTPEPTGLLAVCSGAVLFSCRGLWGRCR